MTNTSQQAICLTDLLLLFLGLKDNLRIPPNAWDFLTVKDLSTMSLLSKDIRSKLEQIEYTSCRDGRDYQVPFPGYPGLFQKQRQVDNSGGLFKHQLASLRAMYKLENNSRKYGDLRGGILGDAPGLGKTISMLALISSTASVRPVALVQSWGRVEEGWSALRNNPAHSSTVLTALLPFRTWLRMNPQSGSTTSTTLRDVQRYVDPPYLDNRLRTISEFERHVIRSLKQHFPRNVLEVFRQNILKIKATLDPQKRKELKSPMGQRLAWERQLLRTSATLIIVPDALLEHWYQQIKMHLLLNVYTDDETEASYTTTPTNSKQMLIPGVVYLDGIGDISDVQSLQNISCSTQGSCSLPLPYELSKYLIVITTFSRCKAEYAREEAAGRVNRKRSRRQAVESDSRSNSSLLQLRWLRMVVDEGHELGTHEAGTATTRLIHEIAAERRWVLSGTPTTGDEDAVNFTKSALEQLQRLLLFLRHPIYGGAVTIEKQTENDEKEDIAKTAWVEDVKGPFLKRKMEGRTNLIRVLRKIMVMHRKENIQLPKPVFRQVEEYATIHKDVEDKLRALTTPLRKRSFLNNHLHSLEFQSRVDETQANYIMKAIEMARKELLNRGGQQLQIGMEDTNTTPQPVSDFQNMAVRTDLRPIKAIVYSSEQNNLLSVTDVLIRRLGHEHVAEMYNSPNSIGDISAELARFRTNMKEFRTCPICQRESNLQTQGKAGDRCTRQLLEVVSNVDGARFMIEPERIIHAMNVNIARLNGEPISNYHKHSKFWKIDDVLEVDVRDPHPLLPKRASEAFWSSMGAEQCRMLAEKDEFKGQDWYFGKLPDAEERSSIVVRLAKWQECGRFHNSSRWYQGKRLADTPVEKAREDVFLLALDAGLSHGLDLSFVTHMFLLEPIDDAALLEQVTSRAHRLGATGPVHVETINVLYKLSQDLDLIMKSAESTLSLDKFNKDRGKALCNIVCQYCYRQFDSSKKAEEHEQKMCLRNPSNEIVADHFHLSSVYREIQPPPPLLLS